MAAHIDNHRVIRHHVYLVEMRRYRRQYSSFRDSLNSFYYLLVCVLEVGGMAAVSMTSFSSVTDAALKSGGVLPQASRPRTIARFAGLRTCPIRNERKANPLRGAVLSGSIRISCAVAAPATLETVISIIAKQLSLEASDVKAESQFSELGADSLDTVEIMMSLEENFDIVLGEEGAEKILTVQDAADLIEAGVHKGKSA